MQDIYSNYYKKKILLIILYLYLKTEIMKRHFFDMSCESVNSKQWVKICKTFGLMKGV